MSHWGKLNVSGRLRVLELPRYYDFPELRLSPAEVRARLAALGNETIVAFQTRNPLHRAHEELTRRALEKTGGVLLLHPVVGLTKAGDVDYYSRVQTYKILTEKYYDPNRVLLALLPLAMRFAGPREALWHARDSPQLRRKSSDCRARPCQRRALIRTGKPFYAPYAAQELVEKFSAEIGVRVTCVRGICLSARNGKLRGSLKNFRRKKVFFAFGNRCARKISESREGSARVVYASGSRADSRRNHIRRVTGKASASGSRA